jgi:hypothetical protein
MLVTKILAVPGILGVVAYLASRPDREGRLRREAALLVAALPAFWLVTLTVRSLSPEEWTDWLTTMLFFAVLAACLLPIQVNLGRRGAKESPRAPYVAVRLIVGALLLALLYYVRST